MLGMFAGSAGIHVIGEYKTGILLMCTSISIIGGGTRHHSGSPRNKETKELIKREVIKRTNISFPI